jgi:HEAT repeat protein
VNRTSKIARRACRVGILFGLLVWPAGGLASPAEHGKSPRELPRRESSHQGLGSLAEARRQAAADGKPILVRVGASYCPWCRKLAAEMEKPAVRAELARWILVDLDQSADDAASFSVEGVPALRILSVRGRLVAARDGYLAAGELVQWLKQSYEAASPELDAVLADSDKPNILAVVRLTRLLAQRDPVYREAAIRRLASCPDVAGAAVVKTLREGKLGARLAALEILTQWHAPIEGLDPWRPETLAAAKFAVLQQWVESGAKPVRPAALGAAERAAARQGIEQMLQVPAGEVEAIRERLARLGVQLLPEVQRRLPQAATDAQRQRLTALRYRLVARDALVLRWPGGLDRLSATDSKQRRKAAEELAAMADAQDQPLLMELFVDADPLVREMGLRGLRNMGGSDAVQALVKLLDDPLPNVRAAVLKQLTEDPLPEMVPAVGEYLKREKDADLAVHAVRFFQAAGGREAVKNLLALMHHPSWQVRAEAAEAVGKALESDQRHISAELKADAYAAAIELLSDDDAFVVSRAVAALGRADMALAVEPLAKAAAKHPELTESVVEIFAQGGTMYAKSLPYLRKFCKHPDPEIRAVALRGIGQGAADELHAELLAGLQDRNRSVRIAAASAVFDAFDDQEKGPRSRLARAGAFFGDIDHSSSDLPGEFQFVTGFIGRALSAFAAKPKGPAAVPPAPSSSGVAPTAARPGDARPAASKPPGPSPGAQQGKTAKKPGESPQATPPDEPPWDQWLRKFYARKRPSGLERMVPPLEKMAGAADAEERLAAAAALVLLGRSETALPVVRECVKAHPEHLDRAARLVPWLLWSDRLRLFDELWPRVGKAHGSMQLIWAMNETHDIRAADRYWVLLADSKLTPEAAEGLRTGLENVYMSNDGGRSQARQRRDLVAAARPRTASGSELQRLVALALLARADREEAAEVARQLAGDQRQSKALRFDAFKVLLATEPKARAAPEAVAALSGTDTSRRSAALDYLVDSRRSYFELRDTISVNVTPDEPGMSGSERGLPPAPPGLTTGQLLPLLRHTDPKVAAYAGYLLALLGEPQGLDKLLGYWREDTTSRDSNTQLVYRAIAALDDSRQLPVLEKIYRKKVSEDQVADFYWTIRAMTGPEILKFRQRIRNQVGMEKLR